MQSFLQDLRYALRQLRKSPAFGLTVIATLALSIGITAAIFSVLYAMLIRPLPYDRPKALWHWSRTLRRGTCSRLRIPNIWTGER